MTMRPVDLTAKPDVADSFDAQSNTISYAVRDPVMEFGLAAGGLTFECADRIIAHIRQRGLLLE